MATEPPGGVAIHASAVAIAGRALLIRGRSRSGKSRLAVALVAASTSHRRIRMIGDDRIVLTRGPRGLLARPHPRLAGFVERRGLGIVATAFVEKARVAGVVEMNDATETCGHLENLLTLSLVDVAESARAATVLRWWDAMVAGAACAPHPPPKLDRAAQAGAKD